MPESMLIRRKNYWNKRAESYDKAMPKLDRYVFGDSREWVCSRAVGRTLEVGIGSGLNLPSYPERTDLTGIDLSPEMLSIARRRASSLGLTIDLREGDAQALPFQDGHFDSVVATFTLCAVPDLEVTLREMDRVLRAGGQLLLADHVRPTNGILLLFLRGLQRLSDRFDPDGGEKYLRRPFESVERLGYKVEDHGRFKGGVVELLRARKVS